MKKISLFTALALSALCLISCGKKVLKPYTEKEVLRRVKEFCPEEEYELIGVEQISLDPENFEYTFKSKERELTFKANSYLTLVGRKESVLSYYEQAFSCDYKLQVSDLYFDDIKQALSQYPEYEAPDGWYNIKSYEEIDTAVQALVKASAVIRPELEFNSARSCDKIYFGNVHFVHYPDAKRKEEHSTWTVICDVAVKPDISAETVYNTISDAYIQRVKDGKIVDPTAPV